MEGTQLKKLLAKTPIELFDNQSCISVRNETSFITDEKVPTMIFQNTFRFAVYGQWCEMNTGNYELMFFIPKSSRVHDYNYGEALDNLNFRTPELATELEEYADVLLENGAFIEAVEPAKIPESGQMSFSVGDPEELLIMTMGIVYNKLPRHEEVQYGIVPKDFAMGHFLFQNGLTRDELQLIVGKYMEDHDPNGDTFMVGDQEATRKLLTYIYDLPSFTELYAKLQAKKKAEYESDVIENIQNNCVIDKVSRRAYQTSFGSHYSTLMKVVTNEYANEFLKMTQEEKDAFILERFILKGTFYPSSSRYYTPAEHDVSMFQHKKRKFDMSYEYLQSYDIIETPDGLLSTTTPTQHKEWYAKQASRG